MDRKWCFLFILAIFATTISLNLNQVLGSKACIKYQCKEPVVNDTKLKVQMIYQGNFTSDSRDPNQLSPVSSMAFIGDKDIVILSKEDGKVFRILNNRLITKPLLDVSVANKWERGLLGIAVSKENERVYVFLYFTESKSGDGRDVCPTIYCTLSATDPSQNRLYRYELKDDALINPKLLFSLPPSNIASHIGGKLLIGPDGVLYVLIGDFHGNYNKTTSTMAMNFRNGGFPDGRAGILRLTQDGKALGNGILGNKFPLNLYYAYGIRNGFGLDFDPLSGKLWDTENGPDFGDEVNLVMPGFNSGWAKIQGIWQNRNLLSGGKIVLNQPETLEDFGRRGKYSAPELVWNRTVAPTALKFLNSDKLGKEYQDDLFVASFNLGEVFHFDLNHDRTNITLPSTYNNSLVAANEVNSSSIFASGLGKITDMEVGPDGNLYVLSRYFGKPTIFEISCINETVCIQ